MKTSLKSLTLVVLSALCLSVAQPSKAAVITLAGGDPGEGLTLNPSLVVAARNLQGASGTTATLQGVSFPTNAGQITTNANQTYQGVSGSGSYIPSSPTANDTALATLVGAGSWIYSPNKLNVNFTGLISGSTYQVNLLLTEIKIGAGTYTRTLDFTYNGVPQPSDTFTTVSGNAYNIERLVTANGSGNITVAVNATNPGNPIMGAAVVSVPEPSTIAIVIGAIGSFAGWRLRRSSMGNVSTSST